MQDSQGAGQKMAGRNQRIVCTYFFPTFPIKRYFVVAK